jgi:hypothetical protein
LFADLHGFGKSFITAMAASGVSQRAAMAIARHTDPRLTASVYTDEALLPLAAEIGKVPRLPSLAADTGVSDPVANCQSVQSTARERFKKVES